MSSSMTTIAGALVMFGAVAAGTYTGRVIPTPAATTPPAVTELAPAAKDTKAADQKPADQPINEQNGQLMPGLTAADYFAAGMACESYRGVGAADDGKMVTMLDGSQKPASDFGAKQSPAVKRATAAREQMFEAAIKSVGIDPATCKKSD